MARVVTQYFVLRFLHKTVKRGIFTQQVICIYAHYV
ncbi:hypothetical protein BMETH_295_1 [methanotrophic bacterial endosymbiont of Bathymodiolus sp.]|nr:hypothetical protein BMETH_295_1 [methanotrophic bacterial endosymbiont of Bathymodiolus sp.]